MNKPTQQQVTNEMKLIINNVYQQLKDRQIHPSGEFDNGGRWYATHQDLVSHIRTPSRAYPYSEMTACRTKKYVLGVSLKFNCKNKEELLNNV